MITAPDNTAAYQGSKSAHEAWIVEALWGHRIEEQPAAPMLLELLAMAEAMSRDGCLLTRTEPGDKHEYIPNQSLQLRNVLFNNSRLDEVLRSHRGNDSACWTQWTEIMKNTASVGKRLGPDFGYLQRRFDSFDEFSSVVGLLRRIALEHSSERSWPSLFVFPIGPAALYEPLNEKADGGLERVRTVFTRTGELAYLMLSRASEELREELRYLLEPHFDYHSPHNRLLMRFIEGDTPDRGDVRSGSYLPYSRHPAFDRFAEDVIALLSLGFQERDSYQYLMLLIPFHVYLYALETARAHLNQTGLPPIVCELVAPRRDLVRRASINSYLDNDSLPQKAVERQLDTLLNQTESEMPSIADDLDENAKIEALEERLTVNCALKKGSVTGKTLDEYRKAFRDLVRNQHKQGTAKGIASLARVSGLASRRGTNQYRYAPTDELLRALVLVNVKGDKEEADLLDLFQRRYGIIIGPEEASQCLDASVYESADFQRNRERLVQRLIGLGLAHRMSDACTYVQSRLN